MQNNFSSLLSICGAGVLLLLSAAFFKPFGSIQRRANGEATGLDNMTLEKWKNRAVILRLSEDVIAGFPQRGGDLCRRVCVMQ